MIIRPLCFVPQYTIASLFVYLRWTTPSRTDTEIRSNFVVGGRVEVTGTAPVVMDYW